MIRIRLDAMHSSTHVDQRALVRIRFVIDVYRRCGVHQVDIDRHEVVLVSMVSEHCVRKLVTEPWKVVHAVYVKVLLDRFYQGFHVVSVRYHQLVPKQLLSLRYGPVPLPSLYVLIEDVSVLLLINLIV